MEQTNILARERCYYSRSDASIYSAGLKIPIPSRSDNDQHGRSIGDSSFIVAEEELLYSCLGELVALITQRQTWGGVCSLVSLTTCSLSKTEEANVQRS